MRLYEVRECVFLCVFLFCFCYTRRTVERFHSCWRGETHFVLPWARMYCLFLIFVLWNLSSAQESGYDCSPPGRFRGNFVEMPSFCFSVGRWWCSVCFRRPRCVSGSVRVLWNLLLVLLWMRECLFAVSPRLFVRLLCLVPRLRRGWLQGLLGPWHCCQGGRHPLPCRLQRVSERA